MTDQLNEAGVEAAGRALHEKRMYPGAWDHTTENQRETWRDDARAAITAYLSAAPKAPNAEGAVWRHKKRGTTYNVIGYAKLQTEVPLHDMSLLVVYRCRESGDLWARIECEFYDGRFEKFQPPDTLLPAATQRSKTIARQVINALSIEDSAGIIEKALSAPTLETREPSVEANIARNLATMDKSKIEALISELYVAADDGNYMPLSKEDGWKLFRAAADCLVSITRKHWNGYVSPTPKTRENLFDLVAALACAYTERDNYKAALEKIKQQRYYDNPAAHEMALIADDALKSKGVVGMADVPAPKAPSAHERIEPMTVVTEDQIKQMVSRFLCWQLPDNFSPDGGISFQKIGNEGTPHEYVRQPSGTNLLDATQAEAMVRHLLAALNASKKETGE